MTFATGVLVSAISGATVDENIKALTYNKVEFVEFSFNGIWKTKYISLLIYTLVILLLPVFIF